MERVRREPVERVGRRCDHFAPADAGGRGAQNVPSGPVRVDRNGERRFGGHSLILLRWAHMPAAPLESARRAILSSSSNPLVKSVRQAVRRGGLTEGGLALLESPHLLDEAIAAKLPVEMILVSESSKFLEDLVRSKLPLRVLSDKLFSEVASTESSQGVVALVRLEPTPLEEILARPGPIVALDAVQDPGNAGTIVRSAEAFGAAGIVFLKGCASPFNPKTMRASAGSLLRLPFASNLPPGRIAGISGRAILAADAGGDPLSEVPLDDVILAIGSEAHGVGPAIGLAARPVAVPTQGVESLNAAAAAAVILYEAARRKAAK